MKSDLTSGLTFKTGLQYIALADSNQVPTKIDLRIGKTLHPPSGCTVFANSLRQDLPAFEGKSATLFPLFFLAQDASAHISL